MGLYQKEAWLLKKHHRVNIKSDISFCVLRFLDEVQSHSNENKMSVQNLATVFGPNILRPKMEDPVALMEGRHPFNQYILLFSRLYTWT